MCHNLVSQTAEDLPASLISIQFLAPPPLMCRRHPSASKQNTLELRTDERVTNYPQRNSTSDRRRVICEQPVSGNSTDFSVNAEKTSGRASSSSTARYHCQLPPQLIDEMPSSLLCRWEAISTSLRQAGTCRPTTRPRSATSFVAQGYSLP